MFLFHSSCGKFLLAAGLEKSHSHKEALILEKLDKENCPYPLKMENRRLYSLSVYTGNGPQNK